MNTPSSRDKLSLADYARILPSLVGGIMVVAFGTGIVFAVRDLGFLRGVLMILVASSLVLLIMGGFAIVGSYLDDRLNKDVVFRLVGAGLGFVVLVFVLFNIAPIILGPYATIR